MLLNLYRDGSDSVSWHADDEIELGPNPIVAAISLGTERVLEFKPKLNFKDLRSGLCSGMAAF